MTDYSELLKLDLLLSKKKHPEESVTLSVYTTRNSGFNVTKIYIGYLPVTTTENVLKEAFEKFCDISEVTIKKGNAQGHFEKFCYGFVTLNMPEKQSMEVIAKVSEEHPQWRLKIKQEANEPQKPQKYARQGYGQPQQPRQPSQPQSQPPPQQYQQPPPGMYHLPQHQMQPPPQMMSMPMSSQPASQLHQGHQMHHQGQLPHQGYEPTQQQHQRHHQGGHQMYQQPQQRYHQSHHQGQGMPYGQHQPHQHQQHHQVQNDKGEIFGQKKYRIMVRELWLGGIPEMIDHSYMTEVMSQFGLVQATEIFPKFAFVKFKRASDAAVAYERASRIYEIFGQNSGFRISFSDPSRRKQIVGNHYQFQKTSILLPVLFLGFPPITSALVDIPHMLSICQKFGPITNYYLKKSTNTQMRSYILFTYDNLKNAIRAKQELCRRKDLLGEKRVEITLLLEEESVTKGRDFTNTERNFVNNGEQVSNDRAKRNLNMKPAYQNYPPQPLIPGNYPTMLAPQNQISQNYPYHNPNPNTSPYGQPPSINPGYGNTMGSYGYYPPPPQSAQGQGQGQYDPKKELQKTNNDVLDILHSVYDQPEDKDKEKKKGPQKKNSGNDKEENTTEIIRQMLGKSDDKKKQDEGPEVGEINQNDNDHDHGKEKEPSWSGFLTWKGSRRTGVDGLASSQSDFSDYSINVSLLIPNQDVLLKQKANIMVLQPTNSISQPIFNEYLKVFKKRTGICMTKNWLIYLMGKNQLSQSIVPIKENQLLVVMERPNIAGLVKDKTMACNDSYFQ